VTTIAQLVSSILRAGNVGPSSSRSTNGESTPAARASSRVLRYFDEQLKGTTATRRSSSWHDAYISLAGCRQGRARRQDRAVHLALLFSRASPAGWDHGPLRCT